MELLLAIGFIVTLTYTTGRQWNGEEFLAILLFHLWMKKLICESLIVNYHR